jgi:hypothetical protein
MDQSLYERLDFDVESLPMDVFELVDSGLEVESLTAGHGMLENGASSGTSGCCSCCCSTCRT